jgi:hypothetical protein
VDLEPIPLSHRGWTPESRGGIYRGGLLGIRHCARDPISLATRDLRLPGDGLSFPINVVPARKSPYNNVLNIFTDPLRVLVDFLGAFVDLLRDLVDIFTHPCVVVDLLLQTNLAGTLDSPCGCIFCTHLVIRHNSSQVLDDIVQGLGMTSVLQELHDPTFPR